jgi:hypothetical protein
MAKAYKLDKLFAMNTDYTMEADKALIIRKISTNDTAIVTPKIAGSDLGPIIKAIAPLPRTYDFDLPLLDLGDFYYVVPENKTLRFNGTAGSYVRCVGEILELGPGEPLPGNYLDRFNNQAKHFLTYKFGQASAQAWANGSWVSLLELVPKTTESYLFKHYVGFNVAGTLTALALGNYRVRFTLDGKPFDNLLTGMAHLGIDAYQMYHPPTYNKNVEPFTLEGFPILVEGDHVFKIEAQNNTGGDLTITTSNYPFIYLICEYISKA